ncbi:MAG: hypothetical protein AB1347_09825 [Acidobacteriota bacterium]
MNHEGYMARALAGEAGEGKDHSASCASCREELEALRSLEQALVEAAPPALGNDIWEARVVAMARPIPGRSGGYPKASVRWSSLAASFLLAAALAAGLRLLPAQNGHPAQLAETSIPAVGSLGWDVSRENATLALLQVAEAVAGEVQEEEDGEADGAESPVFGGENG